MLCNYYKALIRISSKEHEMTHMNSHIVYKRQEQKENSWNKKEICEHWLEYSGCESVIESKDRYITLKFEIS